LSSEEAAKGEALSVSFPEEDAVASKSIVYFIAQQRS
jgi:hypothetical protein